MIALRAALAEDIPQLVSLWVTCFREKREAAELFFERNISYTHGYVAEDSGKPVAAVYLVDCTLCGERAHYLCGAATLPEYRGGGVMTSLMRFALGDAEKRGDRFSVLLPADEGLYDFYARFGYLALCSESRAEFDCGFYGTPAKGKPELRRLQLECRRDKFLLWNNKYIEFARDYYACYGAYAAESQNAFALYERSGDRAEVFYAIYNDFKEFNSLLYAEGIRRFTLCGGADDPQLRLECPQKRGMVLPLADKDPPQGIYIGLTLS